MPYKNDFEKLRLILRGDATETVFETTEFREIIAPMLREMEYNCNVRCIKHKEFSESDDTSAVVYEDECPEAKRYEKATEKFVKKIKETVTKDLAKVLAESITANVKDIADSIEESIENEVEELALEDFLE